MFFGSIIEVGPPTNTDITDSNISMHNGHNIAPKTTGLTEADIDATSADNRNDTDSHVGGKTSGMVEEDYVEEINESSNADDENSKDGDYVPADLVCSDEPDYDNLPSYFDDDDFLFTSFQKDKSPNKNRVEGGPKKPDVSLRGCSNHEGV